MAKQGIRYALIRWAKEKRIAVVNPLSPGTAKAQIQGFSVISARPYFNMYYPGTLRPADYKTQCAVYYDQKALCFELMMEEPHLEEILRRLSYLQ